MNPSAYFRLIRPVNLLIILLTQTVLVWKFGDRDMENLIATTVWITLATCLAAAGGYIVNDIFDTVTDAINKPGKQIIPNTISKRNAWLFYIVVTLLVLGCAWQVGSSEHYFLIITLAVALFLLIYAMWLKRLPLAGNLVVAGCSAAVIGVCLPLMSESGPAYFIVFSFTCFSFFVSLLRELVKDIEDIEGDKAAGFHTYPIFAGVKGSKILLYAISGIQIIMCGIFTVFAWGIQYKALALLMGLIIIGFFFLIERLSKAREKGDFAFCSLLLKILMFFGIICLTVI